MIVGAAFSLGFILRIMDILRKELNAIHASQHLERLSPPPHTRWCKDKQKTVNSLRINGLLWCHQASTLLVLISLLSDVYF